jgi:hypothetical protein|tara:strand:- start:22 stop:228 length:207 start_codon:yes stop_codon:yes gene_type:complete
MNKELIAKDNKMYEIINILSSHMFANKDGSINQHILGMYVHENGGSRVLQRENKLLICKEVEEANIIG